MRTRRAFTLVELLVVIGIIALLVSILLPSLAAARRNSNSVKCLSNLRQLGNAFAMYANENKGFWPVAAHDVNRAVRLTREAFSAWVGVLTGPAVVTVSGPSPAVR